MTSTVTPSAAPTDSTVQFRTKRKASAISTVMSKALFDKEAKYAGAWIIGLTILEKNPGLDRLRELLRERLVSKYVRFRSQLVINEKGEAEFHELDVADIDYESYHVPDLSELTSAKPWSRNELFEYLAKLNEFEYDLSRPLWRYLLIPNLENGEAAIISSISHAIGDGLALIEVLEGLYDKPPSEQGIKHTGKKMPSSKFDFLTKLGIFLYGIYHGLSIPLARPDPPNKLRLKKGVKPLGKKLIASAQPIDLERVKEIKNKMEGTTINDVLMGLMTMTLKSFFTEEEPENFKKNQRVTAQFPISMRGLGEGGLDAFGEPHNKISYAYFDFHFDGSRTDIIWDTKFQIDCIKISPSPVVVGFSAKLINNLLPTQLMLNLTRDAANLGSAQLSNVPAPQGQVSLLGVKVVDMSFFLFSPLACYLGILTYNNKVVASFNLDSGLGVDPKILAKHWSKEFEELYKEVMSKEGVLTPPKFDIEFYKKVSIGTIGTIVAFISLIILRMLVLFILSKLR